MERDEHIPERVRAKARALLACASTTPTSLDAWQGVLALCAEIGGVFSHEVLPKPAAVEVGQVWKYEGSVNTYRVSMIRDGSVFYRVRHQPETWPEANSPFSTAEALLRIPGWVLVSLDEAPTFPPFMTRIGGP